ncbi:MAG TPA: hypothetical protein VJ860_15380 [Polyangia bacterium]|jgi:hypothetical protein|nr:hypothetical protein [Polyangia bacterium]
MTNLSRVTCLLGLATALVVSTSGCDPYTYYNVHITFQLAGDNFIKVPNTLNKIAACDISVYANDGTVPIETNIAIIDRTQGRQVNACRGSETAKDTFPDLGILDYSTARSSGTLSFKVRMYDGPSPPHNVIVEGSTDSVGVNPGHVLPTVELVASPCGPAVTTDQPSQPTCSN